MAKQKQHQTPKTKKSSAIKAQLTSTAKDATQPPAVDTLAASTSSVESHVEKDKDTVLRKLPSAWSVAKKSLGVLGIAAIYALLNILLVRGFSGATDLTPLKEIVSGEYPGGVGQLTTGLTLFALLFTASGTGSSDVASAYQTFLIVVTSLAVVWALRQVMAGEERVRIRDSFYKGMYPLVPVLLVLLVVLLQLLPMILGAGIYSLVVSNGIAVNVTERILWSLVLFGGLLTSLYLVASSIFAAYIAALPDMTPIKALRSARGLVRHRRWSVLRKLLFLPLAVLVVSAVIMVPIILVLTPLAPWIFFILSMVGLVVIHAYLYTLYRELLV
jgi:hypothetical protein